MSTNGIDFGSWELRHFVPSNAFAGGTAMAKQEPTSTHYRKIEIIGIRAVLPPEQVVVLRPPGQNDERGVLLSAKGTRGFLQGLGGSTNALQRPPFDMCGGR